MVVCSTIVGHVSGNAIFGQSCSRHEPSKKDTGSGSVFGELEALLKRKMMDWSVVVKLLDRHNAPVGDCFQVAS